MQYNVDHYDHDEQDKVLSIKYYRQLIKMNTAGAMLQSNTNFDRLNVCANTGTRCQLWQADRSMLL